MKKYAKKYALAFIIIVFAITMILWPLATTESFRTTQEDPGTAESSYSVSLNSLGDYADVLKDLKYDSLEELNIELPADIQVIIDRYKELIAEIGEKLTELDGIEVESDKDAVSDEDAISDEDAVSDEDAISDEVAGLLVEAESYLDEGELGEDELKNIHLTLTSASGKIEEINDLLEDVDTANEKIIKEMGSLAPTDQTKKAKELRARLLDDKDWWERLWAEYEEVNPQDIITSLEIDVQKQIYPGQTYTIHGEITYEGETPAIERDIRDITLLWDDEPLNTANSYRAQRDFEIELTLDEDTSEGEHTLTVIVEPKDSYRIASVAKYITVTKDLPDIRIEDLSYKLLSRKVQIKGKLDSETPLHDAILVIELKGRSTEVSPSPEGEFEALLDLPLGLVNIGRQEIKIRFEPSEARQSPTEITTEIFVMDIFSLGFISTAFVALGMVVYVTRRGRPGKGGSGILEMPPSPEPDLEFINAPQQGFKEEYQEGIRGQIAKSYIKTMKIVENITGVSMEPHMTLREFLRETRPKLNGAAGAFKELTRLAEDALYCPRIPSSDDADRAERLSLTVKETLK